MNEETNDKLTQKSLVLRRLLQGRSITPLDALRDFGCMRLGAIIHCLRREGYSIVTSTATATSRYGHPVRYASYKLLQPPA